jgi:cyanophycin synthetase
LQNLVTNLEGHPKVGIIAGIGDRRVEDTIEVGQIAGEMFDEIIIRIDRDLRGRTQENLIELLMQGICSVAPYKPVKVILKETDAIDHAIQNARQGSLIVLFSDDVSHALEQVMKHKDKEEAEVLYPMPHPPETPEMVEHPVC